MEGLVGARVGCEPPVDGSRVELTLVVRRPRQQKEGHQPVLVEEDLKKQKQEIKHTERGEEKRCPPKEQKKYKNGEANYEVAPVFMLASTPGGRAS